MIECTTQQQVSHNIQMRRNGGKTAARDGGNTAARELQGAKRTQSIVYGRVSTLMKLGSDTPESN